MKQIGFSINEEKEYEKEEKAYAPKEEEAKQSVVTVRFENGREYPYYNDKFNLKINDLVFVDGKLYGQVGKVIKVTTKFKISTKYYKEVIAKLDTTIHGKFKKAECFMLAKGNNVVPFEQIEKWFKPPIILKEDEKEEKFILGEGYETLISDITKGDEFSTVDYLKGEHYFNLGKVEAITVNNKIGHAVVKNNHAHIVDFKIKGGKIYDIYCDCISPDFCHHAFAVCAALSALFKDEIITEDDNFTAINSSTFYYFVKQIEAEITI